MSFTALGELAVDAHPTAAKATKATIRSPSEYPPRNVNIVVSFPERVVGTVPIDDVRRATGAL
jgi:hypothetical protein